MSRLQKLLGVGKGYLERLPPVDVHKLLRLILLNLPYIMIFYVGNKLAWLYQYCAGNSMIERLIVLVLNFQLAKSSGREWSMVRLDGGQQKTLHPLSTQYLRTIFFLP